MGIIDPAPMAAGTGYKLSKTIDFFKLMTLPFCLCMITFHNEWNNTTALIYTAIHGTYGILWATKSAIFPDPKFSVDVPLWYFLMSSVALMGYWRAPYSIFIRNYSAPEWIQGFSVMLFSFGVFFHFASDMQKHVCLKLNPGKLITWGLWKNIRNPNYFGELLIYASFAILAADLYASIILGTFILGIWIPNMRDKEKSLSRYPEFAHYRDNSWYFIPFVY